MGQLTPSSGPAILYQIKNTCFTNVRNHSWTWLRNLSLFSILVQIKKIMNNYVYIYKLRAFRFSDVKFITNLIESNVGIYKRGALKMWADTIKIMAKSTVLIHRCTDADVIVIIYLIE